MQKEFSQIPGLTQSYFCVIPYTLVLPTLLGLSTKDNMISALSNTVTQAVSPKPKSVTSMIKKI